MLLPKGHTTVPLRVNPWLASLSQIQPTAGKALQEAPASFSSPAHNVSELEPMKNDLTGNKPVCH